MPIHMTSAYSLQTQGARDCILLAADDLAEACRAAPALGGVFRFADYGAADGGTAEDTWRRVLEDVLGRVDVDRSELLAVDLPANDFDGLAQTVARVGEDRDDVLVAMVPRSFYARCAAPGSVSLGFSATAMHWLSRVPRWLDDHTHANATPDEAARAAFAEQSRDDLRAVLRRRAEELAPGGRLVLVNLARDDEGHYLGHNGHDRNMHEVLHELWRGLLDEGRIDQDAYRRGTFQNYYRSEAELTVDLAEGTPLWEAGLWLVGSRIERVPCPYRARFERDGDVEAFATGLMGTVRSWGAHTFLSALADRDDAQEVVDTLYDRYRSRVAAEPHRHSMDYVQSYLQLAKVGG